MDTWEIVLLVLALLVVLPVLAYMIMKFGTTGYLRARGRDRSKTTNEEK
jgi:cytochrome c oxidase subunit IV